MRKIVVKVAENLTIPAHVIKDFEADDASDIHYILYCQNRIVDYMIYSVFKDWEGPLSDYLESPDDIIIEDDDKCIKYAHITVLVDYCTIPELD